MEFVVTMFVLAGAALAVWCLLVALVIWRLRCRNRVSARTATAAPLAWLGSPARAARLHRRLRAAVATMRLRVPAPSRRRRSQGPVGELADELEVEAARLDDQLVLARRAAPAARRQLLDALEADVRRVEDLAGRVSALAVAAGAAWPDPWDAPLDHIDRRLGTLESARAELDHLEAAIRLPHTVPHPSPLPGGGRGDGVPAAPRGWGTATGPGAGPRAAG